MFEEWPEFLLRTRGAVADSCAGAVSYGSARVSNSPSTGLRMTWMGHSTSVVEIDGSRLLVDPVWDESAAPVRWTGPKRFFPAPLALDDLPAIDAIVISHDHYDHLGADTIRRLANMEKLRNVHWIVPVGVENVLRNFGVDVLRCTALNWTESVKVGSVTITALPARHFSGRGLFNRFETLWASFAFIGPVHRVYYGADSGEWYGFGEIGAEFGPFDLTMLEIGASDPLWADIHIGPGRRRAQLLCSGWPWAVHAYSLGLFDLALHYWTQPIESVFAVEDLKRSPTPGIPTDVVRGEEIRSRMVAFA